MTEKPQPTSPPRYALIAAVALPVSGLFAVLAALAHLGNRDWIKKNRLDALKKTYDDSKKAAADLASYKKNRTASELSHFTDNYLKGVLINGAITLLITGFLAYAIFKGRHWSRWGVIGVWVLSTLTGSFVGLFSLLIYTTGSGIPITVRIPALVASVAYLVAVAMVCLRPSVEYFALSRPDRGTARPPRSGLFGPRLRVPQTPPSGARVRATTPAAQKANLSKTPAATRPAGRTKQRASADAVAKGADLARNRAKAASKSRRTGS